jgi:hypothetical protein
VVTALAFEGAQTGLNVVLKFGGGMRSASPEDEIDLRECADGKNYTLDLESRQFRPRTPFDLLGKTPNAAEIRGFASLLKSDGTVSMLVQSGANVYEWDGSGFTLRGTCDANAKLRGRLEHNWQLDDKVLITDINLQQPVMEWNGTTLQNITHNLTGDFKARYCFVSKERAYFGNVESNAVATPHMLVGGKRSDFTTLSTTVRPPAAAAEDPFFLLTPDLYPINGLEEAFGRVVISSEQGSIFNLTGENATDFAIDELYPRSGAAGQESVRYIGNDIIYGRPGRVESVLATEKFGDVQSDDITRPINDQVKTYKSWSHIVYNSRLQRVYFFPTGITSLWVYHKDLAGTQFSPWSQWTTRHSMSFTPTAVMNMLDPGDKLEYVFMGDDAGNIYRLEGTGSGDGGATSIQSERLSQLFCAPLDSEVYDIEGWVQYRKKPTAVLIKLNFEFAGMSVFNSPVFITIPAATGGFFYGGDVWYLGNYWYGARFVGRLFRQKFTVPGQSNCFQVRITSEGTDDFEIAEIGMRFHASS